MLDTCRKLWQWWWSVGGCLGAVVVVVVGSWPLRGSGGGGGGQHPIPCSPGDYAGSFDMMSTSVPTPGPTKAACAWSSADTLPQVLACWVRVIG